MARRRLDALAVIEPELRKTGVSRGCLTKGTLSRLRKWFDRVEERSIGGMVLTRDPLGWCRVDRVRVGSR